MDSQILTYLIAGAGAAGAAAAIARARRRLQLSGAKHPSLAGHARISSRLAKLIPFYEFGEDRFFCSDGAPPEIAKRRQMAFEALARDYEHRFANTIALKAEIKDVIWTCSSPTPTVCPISTAASFASAWAAARCSSPRTASC